MEAHLQRHILQQVRVCRLPCGRVDNFHPDVCATPGPEWVFLQVLGSEVHRVRTALVGVLAAEGASRVEASQISAEQPTLASTTSQSNVDMGVLLMLPKGAWGPAITYWQSCRKTNFSCEVDPCEEEAAHKSSKVALTARSTTAVGLASRCARLGVDASREIAPLRYSCVSTGFHDT